jgi:hypothetical protein
MAGYTYGQFSWNARSSAFTAPSSMAADSPSSLRMLPPALATIVL